MWLDFDDNKTQTNCRGGVQYKDRRARAEKVILWSETPYFQHELESEHLFRTSISSIHLKSVANMFLDA